MTVPSPPEFDAISAQPGRDKLRVVWLVLAELVGNQLCGKNTLVGTESETVPVKSRLSRLRDNIGLRAPRALACGIQLGERHRRRFNGYANLVHRPCGIYSRHQNITCLIADNPMIESGALE